MIEIEAKMKVDDLDQVRAKLVSLGAESAGSEFEINLFFDTPDHALRRGDRGLRLRIARPMDGPGETQFIVTSKGPRLAGTLKSREEIEFSVDDGDAAAKLFDALGYSRELSFEKRRRSWKLGGCKVELDELPILGTFVEIEGPGEDAVNAVRKSLEMLDRPLIHTSYIAMLADYLKRHGDLRRDVKF